MLEIKNLHVKLEEEDKVILKGVNLTIEPGTVHAIMGPNGSGKSTLSLLLARLWDPGSGDISIDGRDLRSFAVSELPKEVMLL